MWWKAGVIWLALMVLAILNGGLRVKAIIPFTGDATGPLDQHRPAWLVDVTWATLPWVDPKPEVTLGPSVSYAKA
jgi:hypothetical protein